MLPIGDSRRDLGEKRLARKFAPQSGITRRRFGSTRSLFTARSFTAWSFVAANGCGLRDSGFGRGRLEESWPLTVGIARRATAWLRLDDRRLRRYGLADHGHDQRILDARPSSLRRCRSLIRWRLGLMARRRLTFRRSGLSAKALFDFHPAFVAKARDLPNLRAAFLTKHIKIVMCDA